MEEVIITAGRPGPTTVITTTDVATLLTTLAGTGLASGKLWARACLLCVEGNPARIAFGGVSPTQGAVGSGAIGVYLNSGDTYRLEGDQTVATARIISAGAGAAAKVQVLGEFA